MGVKIGHKKILITMLGISVLFYQLHGIDPRILDPFKRMYERSKQQSYDLFTSPLFWTVAAGSGLIAFAAWNLYKKGGVDRRVDAPVALDIKTAEELRAETDLAAQQALDATVAELRFKEADYIEREKKIQERRLTNTADSNVQEIIQSMTIEELEHFCTWSDTLLLHNPFFVQYKERFALDKMRFEREGLIQFLCNFFVQFKSFFRVVYVLLQYEAEFAKTIPSQINHLIGIYTIRHLLATMSKKDQDIFETKLNIFSGSAADYLSGRLISGTTIYVVLTKIDLFKIDKEALSAISPDGQRVIDCIFSIFHQTQSSGSLPTHAIHCCLQERLGLLNALLVRIKELRDETIVEQGKNSTVVNPFPEISEQLFSDQVVDVKKIYQNVEVYRIIQNDIINRLNEDVVTGFWGYLDKNLHSGATYEKKLKDFLKLSVLTPLLSLSGERLLYKKDPKKFRPKFWSAPLDRKEFDETFFRLLPVDPPADPTE